MGLYEVPLSVSLLGFGIGTKLVRPDPGYVIKQCPRIVMNKIFDWH